MVTSCKNAVAERDLNGARREGDSNLASQLTLVLSPLRTRDHIGLDEEIVNAIELSSLACISSRGEPMLACRIGLDREGHRLERARRNPNLLGVGQPLKRRWLTRVLVVDDVGGAVKELTYGLHTISGVHEILARGVT